MRQIMISLAMLALAGCGAAQGEERLNSEPAQFGPAYVLDEERGWVHLCEAKLDVSDETQVGCVGEDRRYVTFYRGGQYQVPHYGDDQ